MSIPEAVNRRHRAAATTSRELQLASRSDQTAAESSRVKPCVCKWGGAANLPAAFFSLQSRAEACFKVKYAVQACFIEHCVCNTLNPKPLNP